MVAVDESVKRASASYRQTFKMRRTHWKSLDSPHKRCNDDGVKANTTHCLTSYVEHMVGCSIGSAQGDPQMARQVGVNNKKA